MNNRKLFVCGVACMALLFAAGSAQAASDSWKADAPGNWNAIGSWLGNQTPGSTTLGNSDVATFSFTLTSERGVNGQPALHWRHLVRKHVGIQIPPHQWDASPEQRRSDSDVVGQWQPYGYDLLHSD